MYPITYNTMCKMYSTEQYFSKGIFLIEGYNGDAISKWLLHLKWWQLPGTPQIFKHKLIIYKLCPTIHWFIVKCI